MSRPVALLASIFLLCSSFTPPSHALEVNSDKTTNAQNTFNSLLTTVDGDLNRLDNELTAEVAIRIQNDTTIRNAMEKSIADTNVRITALEALLPPLAAKVEGLNINVTNELNKVKADVANIRTEMNWQVSILDSAITTINNQMASSAANLQSQINTTNGRISNLYSQVNALNTRLTNLYNFLTDINSRLTALRNCVNAGGCVGQRAPTVSVHLDIKLEGQWSFGQGSVEASTGLPVATWQYCSVSRNTNMGGRDFHVFQRNGYWWMSTENDNAAPGDEVGNLYANCMRLS